MNGPPPPPPPPPATERKLTAAELAALRSAEQPYRAKVSLQYARQGCELPTILKVLDASGGLARARSSDTPDIFWLDFAHITSTNRELVAFEAKFDPAFHKNGVPAADEWGEEKMHFRKPRPGGNRPAPGATLTAQAQAIKGLLPNQCVNFFVGMANVCNKANLASFLGAYQRSHPHEQALAPQSWTLPLESEQFAGLLAEQPHLADEIFIVKPEVGSKAQGITFYRGGDVLDDYKCGALATGDKRGRTRMVVQRYLNDPLLISGRKWDLRVYLLVTCLRPFKAYLYHDGLARFCANEYVPLKPVSAAATKRSASVPSETNKGSSKESSSASNKSDADGDSAVFSLPRRLRSKLPLDTSQFFTHITNYAVNKKAENFDMEACKRTANQAFSQYFHQQHRNAGVQEKDIQAKVAGVWNDVGQVCVSTVRAIGPYLRATYAKCFLNADNPDESTGNNISGHDEKVPARSSGGEPLNAGPVLSPEWVAYVSRDGTWMLVPPAESRDNAVHALYNDADTMLPSLPMLSPMSIETMKSRRKQHRTGYTAAAHWHASGTPPKEASQPFSPGTPSCFFDVVDCKTGQLLGTSGFREITTKSVSTNNKIPELNDTEPPLATAEWGIVVAASARRRGICTESFMACASIAPQLWGCKTLTAKTLGTNAVMVRFLERTAGMRPTGYVAGDWVEFSVDAAALPCHSGQRPSLSNTALSCEPCGAEKHSPEYNRCFQVRNLCLSLIVSFSFGALAQNYSFSPLAASSCAFLVLFLAPLCRS